MNSEDYIDSVSDEVIAIDFRAATDVFRDID